MMETESLNKFLIAKTKPKKSCDWTTDLIALHLKYSETPEPKSAVKMILYNYLPERSHAITFPYIAHPNSR